MGRKHLAALVLSALLLCACARREPIGSVSSAAESGASASESASAAPVPQEPVAAESGSAPPAPASSEPAPASAQPEASAPTPSQPGSASSESEAPAPVSSEPASSAPAASQPAAPSPESASSEEDPWYVPAIVQELLRLTNYERRSRSIDPLALDETLCAAASLRAREAVELWSHERPDGSLFSTVLAEYGVSYAEAGENLFCANALSAQLAVEHWMDSDAHRENLLHESFTLIGLGVAEGADGYWYYTQIFLSP